MTKEQTIAEIKAIYKSMDFIMTAGELLTSANKIYDLINQINDAKNYDDALESLIFTIDHEISYVKTDEEQKRKRRFSGPAVSSFRASMNTANAKMALILISFWTNPLPSHNYLTILQLLNIEYISHIYE